MPSAKHSRRAPLAPPVKTTVAPNVYRHNTAGFDGYRVLFRNKYAPTQLYFSRNEYGGLKPAKEAAIKMADHIRAKIEKARKRALRKAPPQRKRQLPHTELGVRNSSGELGVVLIRDSWAATWYDPPRVLRRIYTGKGETGRVKASEIRKKATKLLTKGKSTQALFEKYSSTPF